MYLHNWDLKLFIRIRATYWRTHCDQIFFYIKKYWISFEKSASSAFLMASSLTYKDNFKSWAGKFINRKLAKNNQGGIPQNNLWIRLPEKWGSSRIHRDSNPGHLLCKSCATPQNWLQCINGISSNSVSLTLELL